ncbi:MULTISPECIES: DUF6090 family protein [Sphingobacterium]|uniref:DUF6090 family protein n=1 Tax=Sphingobacterium TaxID=28453 RepID=UPI000EC15446|nr:MULTISPECIES: DUF6090 family protein [Sphingobacterium]HCX58728.1 hypothetical protein [Sphingobacterium sp.]
MQDEIIKHTKKIYKTAKEPKHSLTEKLKEISIEIFIIVFAVSLSIWLHGWSEHRHEQQEVKEFLEDLKVDLEKDVHDLEKQNSYLTNTAEGCKFYGELNQQKIDSLVKVSPNDRIKMNLNPIFKIRNTGNYEGFRSSGKIGLIKDRKLKTGILEYYQTVVPSKDDWQTYYNSLVFNLADELVSVPNANINPDLMYKAINASPKVKGILINAASQANMIIQLNDQVIKSAKEIIAEIEHNNE